MSQHALIPFQSLLVFTFLACVALPAAAATDARLSESYGKLPLQFEANRGQTHKDVRFLSRGPGYSLYLTAGEAVLVLAKPDTKRDTRSTQVRPDAPAQANSVALRMSLVGAARKPQVTGLDELPGKANYFVGKDPAKWRTNVPTYAKVQYRNVYPGIDLVYYGNQRQLEYDFVVAPGADPNKIVLGFKGAEKLEIDVAGDLVLHAAGGDIRQHKPVIYQDIDGVRQEVASGYVRKGANHVAFKVAAYDTNRPLVIDPVVLSYSTYLGGSARDLGTGIAVDAAGNAYVTGNATSVNFPTTPGASQTIFGGDINGDVFITKLNPAGSALVYSTYLGGSGMDQGAGIAVDAAGNAYVTGYTRSNDFPVTAGAFQTAFAGSAGAGDAFVAKINATGSGLVYSTYLGGNGDELNDFLAGIAVDAAGNAYVAGSTRSTDFPTTAGAFQSVHSGAFDNAFVTKLDPAGSTLVYSTFLGESLGHGIAVDANGNAYVTGTVQGAFPTTPGSFQPNGGGAVDAFVTKLDFTGTTLVYSTRLGGGSFESGQAIAVDAAGNAYVTGDTRSTNFPTTPGAFQPTFGGALNPPNPHSPPDPDAFVTKLDPSGSVLIYSTYLGGSGSERGLGIAVDADGNAYVTGWTASTNFPTTVGAFQLTLGGVTDGFVTKLNSTGIALVYSSYLGGTGNDNGSGVAVDADSNAYVTGWTASTNFPTTAGAFQLFNGGDVDAFVAKIGDLAPPPPPAPTGTGTTRSEESAATEIGFWTTYGAETGTFSGGSIVASNVAASTAMFSFTGTAVSWIGVKCNVCGIAAVSIDGGAPTTVNMAGPNAPGSLTSESVFSASGLAAEASHTMVIAVTGMSSSGGAYVAVDAFDVTAGTATSPIVPTVVLPPPPVVVPPLPPVLGL
jgi:beta-propeller repeat-containing protein